VVIEGHTDNVNRSGNPEYNTILGQRRADSVRDVILDMGVAARRVKEESHGKDDPAVPNWRVLSEETPRPLNLGAYSGSI